MKIFNFFSNLFWLFIFFLFGCRKENPVKEEFVAFEKPLLEKHNARKKHLRELDVEIWMDGSLFSTGSPFDFWISITPIEKIKLDNPPKVKAIFMAFLATDKLIPRKTEIIPFFKKIKRDFPYEEGIFPENKPEFIRKGKQGVFWESLIKIFNHTSFPPGSYFLNLELNFENGEKLFFEKIPFKIQKR